MTHRFNLAALTLLLVPACNKESAGESASGKNASAATAPGASAPGASAPGAGKPGTTPASAATAAEAKTAAPTTPVGVTSATVIEAGCSYDGTQLKGNEGDIFQVACPAGCEKGQPTWGTGVYSAHSAICRAGIHAGAIPATGGTVSVRLESGRPAYRGSEQNGIKSSDYNDYKRSYAVLLSGNSAAPAATATAAGSPDSLGASDKPVIEAGCSYDGTQLKGNDGDIFQVSCPAGCEKGQPTWGTGVYSAHSAICRAGIHAGAIPATGGTVSVRLEPGRPAYRGSEQNSIKSSDYNDYKRSYAVLLSGNSAAPAATAPVAGSADKSVIEAGCSYDGTQLKGNDGDIFQVACPAGCEKGQPTWGTGVYTAHSPICRAGIHAGAIKAEGGTVSVRLEPGRPAYRGSEQNSIKSSDYNEFKKSYAVVVEGAKK